ncbi:MAG: ATP-grasp domain-containing protein [Sedimentisphaerales bacterium]|nr:ATP-grasp domain-containing protein [Sedimentisphaerales bacterium]
MKINRILKNNVLIIDASAKSAIPVMESCAGLGLHVVAMATKRYCCGVYSRAVRERHFCPPPEQSPDVCMQTIISLLKRKQFHLLIPLGHIMTEFIARHQDIIRQYTQLILPPYPIFRLGLDKIDTLKAAEAVGCPTPRSWYPEEQSLDVICREVSYPVLIKPSVSVGARGISFCHNDLELQSKFPTIEDKFGRSFIQEFIPQTGMQYKTAFILGPHQETLAGIVYAKLRYYPVNGGSSTLNQSVHQPDILKAGLKVAKHLKWVGPCDCDFITDPRDNTPKLMEINPRFSDTYKMVQVTGMDWIKILYELSLDHNPRPQLEYKPDCYLRFIFGDLMWFLKSGSQRWSAKPSFFNVFQPNTRLLMAGTNDWGPFMGYILDNLSVLLDKKSRQFRFQRHG